MRNLKRALSLTLASVMLLGMMVVGSSAASYPDVDSDEHNIEAIDVLQTVGVMVGDADTGNFRPNDNVKRSEMARIMADLMDLNYDYYTGSNPFTDMEGHWAEKYVAACYTNGIIAGRTETTYDPEATVTAVEAAAMLMRALGYFQNKDVDYEGGFVVATVRQAGKIDLFNDVATKTNDPMTRNDVAQLVLNTLKSGMVEPDNGNKIDVNLPGGGSVSIGATNYVYVTSREKYAEAIYDTKVENSASSSANLNAPIVELGEKLYQGDLVLKDWRYGGETDDFGRPASTWTYQAKDIGTYAEEAEEHLTFAEEVTPKALYNAVGKTAAEKYAWTIKLNGETQTGFDKAQLVSNQTVDSGDFFDKCGGSKDLTGNGVLTQVYVDGTEEEVIVAITHFYAAEVYTVKDGKITLSKIESDAPSTTSDEFDAAGFEEDDIVYFTFAQNKIQSVEKADRIEGTVTKAVASTEDENGKNFNLGDDNYKYINTMDKTDALTTDNVDNNMVGYTMPLGGKDWCIYIDWANAQYDYAYVLSAGTDSDKADNVTGKDETVWARLVFPDGTMKTVETDAEPNPAEKQAKEETKPDGLDWLRNHIVSYSKNSSNVYSLTVKDEYDEKNENVDGTGKTLTYEKAKTEIFRNGKSKIWDANGKSWTANNNTVVIVGESGNTWNNYSFTVYTGVENIPDIDSREAKITSICVAAGKNKVAKVVYVENADVSGNGDVVFVIANQKADQTHESGNSRYYNLTAFVDGEKVSDFNVKKNSDAYNMLVTNARANFGEGGKYATKTLGQRDKAKNDQTKFIVPLRVVTRDADNLVTNVKPYELGESNTNRMIVGAQTTKNNNGAIGLKDNGSWYVLKDARQVRYDVKNDVYSTSSTGSVKDSTVDEYVGVVEDGDLIGLFVVDYVEPEDGGKPGTDTKGNVTVAADSADLVKEFKGELKINEFTNAATLKFEFKAPAWAEKANTRTEVSFKYVVKVDGKELASTPTAVNASELSNDVYTYSDAVSAIKTALDNEKIPADAKITVEVSDVKWTNAVVEYQYADKTDASKQVTGPNKLAISSTADKTLSFTFTKADGQEMKDAKWTVEGVNVKDTDVKTTGELKSGTAVTFTSNIAAKGGTKVIVKLSGVTAAQPAKTYKATSVTTGVNELELCVVKKADIEAGKVTVPTTKANADKLTGWAKEVEANEGDTILVRAKNGGKVTALAAADIFVTGTYNKATLGSAPADINGSTGVFKFTMGKENVTINKVTTDTPVISKISIAPDGTQVNVLLENGRYSALTDADGATIKDADYVRCEAVMNYINDNSKTLGWTAKLDTPDADGTLVGLTLNNGVGDVDIAFADVKATDDLATATINGKEYVLNNATITGVEIEKAIQLAIKGFVASDIGSTSKWVKITDTSDGSVTMIKAALTSSDKMVADATVDVIDAITGAAVKTGTVTYDENGNGEFTLPEGTKLTDVSGDPNAADSSYSTGLAVKGHKLGIVKYTLPKFPASDTDASHTHVVIKQINSALAPSYDDGHGDKRIEIVDGKYVKIGSPIVESQFNGTNQETTVVIDDNSIVTLEFYATDSTQDATKNNQGTIPAGAKPFATITIDTSKIIFE